MHPRPIKNNKYRNGTWDRPRFVTACLSAYVAKELVVAIPLLCSCLWGYAHIETTSGNNRGGLQTRKITLFSEDLAFSLFLHIGIVPAKHKQKQMISLIFSQIVPELCLTSAKLLQTV